MSSPLLKPLQVGALTLENRVLMAPLTRMRATAPGDVPNELMRDYYWQRAGGRMAAQLWHVGRVSHESFHGGQLPVSASALPFRNRTTIKGQDGRPVRAACPTPRALEVEEIADVVAEYRSATTNAREAGFDLVEIHAAHGYLLQQFMAADSNRRDDEYGGSLANRARLTLEVVDAAIDAWGAERVGIRISPLGSFNGVDDPAGAEPDWVGGDSWPDDFRRQLRDAFPGPLVAAGGYDVAKAERLLEAGLIDAAAFGRAFIANPDLPERILRGGPFNEPDNNTYYGGGSEGYVDYPALRH